MDLCFNLYSRIFLPMVQDSFKEGDEKDSWCILSDIFLIMNHVVKLFEDIAFIIRELIGFHDDN